MDYFSKFIRAVPQLVESKPYDEYTEFVTSWTYIKNTLTSPDERQIAKGIKATNVHDGLQTMTKALTQESRSSAEGETGACMEYLLKNDVLGTLVRLSEPDRPAGVQVEVLRAVHILITDLDEQFLVHSVVHRAVLRLLKACVGDDIQEQLDGRGRLMGAARSAVRTAPSEYEEDLVGLLCLLCSRIRTFRELLMIFFYDKQWYHSEALASVPEEDEEEERDDEEEDEGKAIEEEAEASTSAPPDASRRSPSPTPSQITVTSAPISSTTKKPEYEFLLFNYLLRFWHREGPTGDSARNGLLFLMDVAMSPNNSINRLSGDEPPISQSSSSARDALSTSPIQIQQDPVVEAAHALAEYILDGDFTEVLGAGLGAVYSVLPSKLEMRYFESAAETTAESGGMVIGSFGPLSEEDKKMEEERRDNAWAAGVEYSSSDAFKQKLDHFRTLLIFLQDVLERDPSHKSPNSNLSGVLNELTLSAPVISMGTAIAQSILDAVRRIFLENVLYPSILECSDADGSAVAVLSYIDVAFSNLHEPHFAEMVLDFLVSEDDEADAPKRRRGRRPRERPVLLLDNGRGEPTILSHSPSSSSTVNKATKVKRRKSSAMMLLEIEAPDARKQTGYLTSIGRFTLKDLLLTNMRSTSQPTVTAALQLMQTLLSQHCFLAIDRLFIYSFEPLPEILTSPEVRIKLADVDDAFSSHGDEEENELPEKIIFAENVPDATYSVHEREMELYLGLASRIDPSHKQAAFSTGYEHYLRDSIAAITGHSCFDCASDILDGPHSKHLLNYSDPMTSSILDSLTNFFSNLPETNVALTGMLVALSTCSERSIQGWLLFDAKEMLIKPNVGPMSAADEIFAPFEVDGDDRSVDFGVADRLAARRLQLPMLHGEPPGQPKIFTILKDLVRNLEKIRGLVENFDVFLGERRQGLLFSENLTDALSLSLDASTGSVLGGVMSAMPQSARTTVGNPETPPRAKTKTKTLMSYLTPRRRTKTSEVSPSPSRPVTPPPSKSKMVDVSPFGSHYQRTRNIVLEPPLTSSSAAWSSLASFKPSSFAVEDDVFGSQDQWSASKDRSSSAKVIAAESKTEQSKEKTKKTVTLSLILDNAVILEECIKELASIIHARRALGIDSIRYL